MKSRGDQKGGAAGADRETVPAPTRSPLAAGARTAAAVALLLVAAAAAIDLPRMSRGFKGDEATYYLLAHSVAADLDVEYRRKDLERVWREYNGPQGIFLKRGHSVSVTRSARFPYVSLERGPDPDVGRLYFAKAHIYPFAAAPFVRLFGTRGFLVLHALLLAFSVGAAVALLMAKGIPRGPAVAFALAFFGVSVVPVYFLWMTPEVFNLALAAMAALFYGYKEAAIPAPSGGGRVARFLAGEASTRAAAVLIGVLVYSKPTHALLLVPIVGLAVVRRQWRRAAASAILASATAGLLFMGHLALTGEANYQGGDRKTFYSQPGQPEPAGFPYSSQAATFDATGSGHATDAVPVDVLVGADTLTVFRHNIWYFLVGRHSGLVPYAFPGALSVGLFLAVPHRRRDWQWLALLGLTTAAAALLLYMPYSYSGGGGPIGNRYYLSMYPWFLLLVPPFRRHAIPVLAGAVGLVFLGQLLTSPFEASRDAGSHVRSGLVRALPIELTTLNDLPVSARPDRARLAMGGAPPVRAYFPDENIFGPEGDGFWIRGRSRADIILRAPARVVASRTESLRITSLEVAISNGAAANTVSVGTGADRATLSLGPFESGHVRVRMPSGVPYKPWQYPVNFVYRLTVSAADGFVPALRDAGSSDARLLGAFVRLSPTYEPAR
jgi:hypothetical protein